MRWRGTTRFLRTATPGSCAVATRPAVSARSVRSWPRCSASTGLSCPKRHAGPRPWRPLGAAKDRRNNICRSVAFRSAKERCFRGAKGDSCLRGGPKCPPAPAGGADPQPAAEVVSCGEVPATTTPCRRLLPPWRRCPRVESCRLPRAAHLATLIFPTQEGSRARSTDCCSLRSAGSAPHRPRCWRPVREPFVQKVEARLASEAGFFTWALHFVRQSRGGCTPPLAGRLMTPRSACR